MTYLGATTTSISTLKAFYDLMHETAVVRRRIVAAIMENEQVDDAHVAELRRARQALASIPEADGSYRLSLDAKDHIDLDLSYELNELDRDILYVEDGEDALIGHLAGLHKDFERQVSSIVELLSGLHFNVFVTDRDGTINNYCGRYESSVQSAYNAVFVSRFAKKRTDHPIILTSAPLEDVGLVDVDVSPPGIFVHAASKGREFVDVDGGRHSFPIEENKKALIDSLEARLRELIAEPAYQKFSLIGSGLQVKFGQITLARQDISNSIDAAESTALLKTITKKVAEIDPGWQHFRIEDTGLDIEMILTVESEDSGDLKDFDKGHGVRYVSKALNLEMSRGPHLCCGDTSSDVPMLRALMDASPADTRAVFVTQKEALAARVREACPGSAIVVQPDVLVTALNRLALAG